MNDQEDLRYLIQHHHEQIHRKLQQMEVKIDHLHAVVYSRSLGKDSDEDGISPYCYRWRRYLGTFLWTLAIAGLIIGCALNLREILKEMIVSPTVTKMTYTFHDNISLPAISIYQASNTPMLHTEKLFKAMENGWLTEAYLEGIIMGLGIGFFNGQNITVQPSELTEAYKKAILRYGSLTEAGLAFQKEYGIACDELFTYCREAMPPPMNCCHIFEFLWGFRGPLYALKRNTIFLDAFRAFIINLRSLPNLESLQEGEFVQEAGNYGSYWIGISNGVDQTGKDPYTFEVQPSETVLITLHQKRRNLKASRHCVDFPPKLQFFRDYTISNCYVERCIIDKFTLCNINCELPLLQLMNPDNLSGPPCEFDAINLTCLTNIVANPLQYCTNHGCRFPCNHTEVEYSVTKEPKSRDERKILLIFKYGTTEVQMFEETPRLTQWEYLGLIGSILDLWIGITIFSLFKMLHRSLSQIVYSKPYDFGKNNSAAAHSASAYQQHEMANLSDTERDRRIRSSNRSYY